MFILGWGVKWHSTFEVTLQIQLFCTHLWKCSSWGGSIDNQLLKWLSNYNFSVLTFGNVHPGGGRLTLNFWSDFANKTFLYSPMEMFILGGVDRQSTFEVTLQIQLFCTHLWKYSSWGGSINNQLLKWLCNYNFSVLTFGNIHPGGVRSTINFWSDFATTTFLYSPLEMFILGGVDWHSTFEVTLQLQLFCTHLWKCSSWGGGQLTLNFWSDFATLTFLYSPLEIFILGGFDQQSTFEVTLQLQLFCTHLWKCSSWGGVDWHSTFEVTLQLQLFCTHLWKCSSWGGGVNWHSTFEVTLQL